MSNSGYIGVDLDGTLACFDNWEGFDHIGEPVPVMVERVQRWLAAGRQVRIITARVASSVDPYDRYVAFQAIEAWCLRHLGQVLGVQAEKDFGLIELWDDRAVQVIANTGELVTVARSGSPTTSS